MTTMLLTWKDYAALCALSLHHGTERSSGKVNVPPTGRPRTIPCCSPRRTAIYTLVSYYNEYDVKRSKTAKPANINSNRISTNATTVPISYQPDDERQSLCTSSISTHLWPQVVVSQSGFHGRLVVDPLPLLPVVRFSSTRFTLAPSFRKHIPAKSLSGHRITKRVFTPLVVNDPSFSTKSIISPNDSDTALHDHFTLPEYASPESRPNLMMPSTGLVIAGMLM